MSGPSGIQGIALAAGTLYGIGRAPGTNDKRYIIDSLIKARRLVGSTRGGHHAGGL